MLVCRTPPGDLDDSKYGGAELEELFSIPLAATVESIAVLRGRSSIQKDALLLTFRLVRQPEPHGTSRNTVHST